MVFLLWSWLHYLFICQTQPQIRTDLLIFSDTKAWRFPSLSFLKQTTVSATPPSIPQLSFSFLAWIFIPPFCLSPLLSSPLLSSPLSSSFAFLDMQAVMQSLLLLWRGCGCEKMEDCVRKTTAEDGKRRRRGKWWWAGGGIQKQNGTGKVWGSMRWRKQWGRGRKLNENRSGGRCKNEEGVWNNSATVKVKEDNSAYLSWKSVRGNWMSSALPSLDNRWQGAI